jgi:6-phosphogluconolactonase
VLQKRHAFVLIAASGVLLSGCGGGGSSSSSPSGGTPSSYTLGGSIAGLTASGLVLANGTSTVSPAASASTFTFATALVAGATYNIMVQTQPTGETCTVASGGGTIGTSPVTNVAVTCEPLEFAYAAGFNGIYAYSTNFDTGALTQIIGSPFGTSMTSGNVAVDPAGHYLFVANGDVEVYRINASTGVLAAVSGSPFSAGGQADFVAIDPSGHFLYAAAVDSQVLAYTIDGTTGALSPVAGSPFAAGANPKGVAVESSGKYVYVVNNASNTVSAYAINQASGALTPIPGSPFPAGSGTGDCFIAADPHSDFIYVYGVTNAIATISPYSIDASTGTLTPASGGSSFAGGTSCGTLAIHPSGMFVYATDPNHSQLWMFSANLTTGALAAGTGAPVTTPNGSAVDPSGQYLYVAAGNAIAGFTIAAATGEIPIAPNTDANAPGTYFVVVAQPKP